MDDLVVMALYRHGVTVDNERKAFCGWTNSILSERGRKELHARTPYVPAYEKIVASDLQRCVDTAKILFPGKVVEIRQEFREMNFGIWEGKVHDEIKHIQEYKDWLQMPLSAPIPQGETFPEFNDRIMKAWEKLIEEISHLQMKRNAIVTHGGVIRSLLTQFAPVKREFWEWKVENGQGFELTGSLSALRRGERCISLREVPLTAKENG
ncbi:alpha-ribazole phosphatase [Oikeobacillus pervagus]|uniref:Alpha-ribazole phosphatase n=1 Tax=Oikeobacillus pervagus TaxID=1325931 RepID=A0AAJ1T0K2_9BACI|nr:histidine phosphatase family protein [Oikeobacillus pervagus]MDQ0216415.1 alpha-ribazole phosphatase [Oikeobacillus pervagus]